MVKTSMSCTKYIIFGNFEVNSLIEKPDLIGAFFGQTEGLIGEELEFNNLQKTGKFGRIEINLKKNKNKSFGSFQIPTALTKIEVSLVAAALESVEKIGSGIGKVTITKIIDAREDKRKQILSRAEEFLKNLKKDLPQSRDIEENVSSNVLKKNIRAYGRKKQIFGSCNIYDFDEIILVEGRADVLNLLKQGFENVISFNGNFIDDFIVKLCKNKTTIAFLDDDTGGRTNFEMLKNKIKLDYVCFAPSNKEVEELNYKEIVKCLKNKQEVENSVLNKVKKIAKKTSILTNVAVEKVVEILDDVTSKSFSKVEFKKIEKNIENIKGSGNFIILDENFKKIKEDKISNFLKSNFKKKGKYLIFDGVCESSVLKKANLENIEFVFCNKKSSSKKVKENKDIKINTFDEFLGK